MSCESIINNEENEKEEKNDSTNEISMFNLENDISLTNPNECNNIDKQLIHDNIINEDIKVEDNIVEDIKVEDNEDNEDNLSVNTNITNITNITNATSTVIDEPLKKKRAYKPRKKKEPTSL